MAEKDARQKRYTEEFKLQAAKLIVEGGYTFSKASQQLGVGRQVPEIGASPEWHFHKL